MLCSDVGAYQKLNLKTLKDIISIHIRNFKSEGVKKFIFCLRDFDENHESFEDLDSTIRDSMDEIWSDVPKPKTLERIKRKEVFSIEVFPIRSYRTHYDGFKQDCKKLLKRVESFIGIGTNNLPLNGFKTYLHQAWNNIKNDKDLNIPNQKKIVSNVRCKEEANIVLTSSSKNIMELEKEIGRKSITKLAEKIKEIINKSSIDYEENTMYYDKEVKEENKINMKKTINNKIKEFQKKSFEDFENKAKSEIEMMINDINFKKEFSISTLEKFSQIKLKIKNDLMSYKTSLVFDENKPEQEVKDVIKRINQHLMSELNKIYPKIFYYHKQEQFKLLREEENKLFNELTEESFNDYIKKIDQSYITIKNEMLKKQSENPDLFVGLDKTFFEDQKNEFYSSTRHNLAKLDMTKIILKMFINKFWNNNRGIPRNWKQIERNDIDELLAKIKKNLFNQIQFLKHDVFIGEEKIDFDFHFNTLISNLDVEIEKIYKNALKEHIGDDPLKGIPKVIR